MTGMTGGESINADRRTVVPTSPIIYPRAFRTLQKLPASRALAALHHFDGEKSEAGDHQRHDGPKP